VMFSEIKTGVHLSVVTATESRAEQRDVYVPPEENDMAHHSSLSPDGKWVLVVEMGKDKGMIQCQLAPFSGGAARSVGPPGGCEYAAWSPDGKWMYLDSKAGFKGYHIWRQRFPDGVPQQLTASLGEEEGIAMASDGKSLVTSVGSYERNIWVHDREGDRQVSSQGYCHSPRLSNDGKRLFYLEGQELLVLDLGSGETSKLLPGMSVARFSISPDDQRVVFETVDAKDQYHLWVTSTEHRFAPREIRGAGGDFLPQYSPSGRIYYVTSENGHFYLYRMRDDGTQEEKIASQPIIYAFGISPDERYVVVGRALGKEDKWWDAEAVPVAGGPWITLCSGWCDASWSRDGKVMYFSWNAFAGNSRTYVIPVLPGSDLPKLPDSGFQSEKELRAVATQVLEGNAAAGVDSSQYTYSKGISARNLYRIPLR
jgi:eukaryotic-like serine/threonine-protein kinase